MTGGRPALVLYARVPRAGAVKTRLTPFLSAAEAAALHRALLIDSLEILRRAAGLAAARAIVSWSEPWDPGAAGGDQLLAARAGGLESLPQPPGDLGRRLAGTLRRLLAAGGPVVVFGADTPTLPPELLAQALDRLRGGAAAVIGPAEDGGFYLIGARRAADGMLAGVAWGTGTACGDACRALRRAGLEVAVLQPWYDIDRPADLERLWRDLGPAGGGGPAAGGGRPEASAAFLEGLARAGRLPADPAGASAPGGASG
jgi:hypothetical protein